SLMVFTTCRDWIASERAESQCITVAEFAEHLVTRCALMCAQFIEAGSHQNARKRYAQPSWHRLCADAINPLHQLLLNALRRAGEVLAPTTPTQPTYQPTLCRTFWGRPGESILDSWRPATAAWRRNAVRSLAMGWGAARLSLARW